MARHLEPLSDKNADRVILAVGAFLFCILFALCSAIPSPEPALPHCPPSSHIATTTVRCQP